MRKSTNTGLTKYTEILRNIFPPVRTIRVKDKDPPPRGHSLGVGPIIRMAIRGKGAETRAIRARAFIANSCPRPSYLLLAGP